MKMNNGWLMVLFSLFVFSSCDTVIVERTNSEDDINEAKEFAINFYSLLEKHKYKELGDLFCDSIPPDFAIKVIKKGEAIFGQFVSYNIENVTTYYYRKNKYEKKTYLITSIVKYEKESLIETLDVFLERDSLAINDYSSVILVE